MRHTLLWTALLSFSLLAFAPAATAGPIVCMGSGCPGALLMCLDDGVESCLPAVPPVNCPAIQYVEEDVGPVGVRVGGCGAQVLYEGKPLLP